MGKWSFGGAWIISKSRPNSLENRGNKRKILMDNTLKGAHVLLVLWQVRCSSCLFSPRLSVVGSWLSGASCYGASICGNRWIFQIPFFNGNNKNNNACNSCANVYWTCGHLPLGFPLTCCWIMNLSWSMVFQLTVWEYLISKINGIGMIQKLFCIVWHKYKFCFP